MGNLQFVFMTLPYVLPCGFKVGIALLFNRYMPPELQHKDLRAFLTSDTMAQGLAQTMFWVSILGLTHAATMAMAIAVNLRRLADMTTLNRAKVVGTKQTAVSDQLVRTRVCGASASAESGSDDCSDEDDGGDDGASMPLAPSTSRGGSETQRKRSTRPKPRTVTRSVNACGKGCVSRLYTLFEGEPLHPGLSVIALGGEADSNLPLNIHRAMVTHSTTATRLAAVNEVILEARKDVIVGTSGYTMRDFDNAAVKLTAAMFSHAQLKLDTIMTNIATITFAFLPLYIANTMGVWGIAPLIIVAHVLYMPLVGSRVLAFGPLYCMHYDALADTLLETDITARVFQIRWRNTLAFGENMMPCWPRWAAAANHA